MVQRVVCLGRDLFEEIFELVRVHIYVLNATTPKDGVFQNRVHHVQNLCFYKIVKYKQLTLTSHNKLLIQRTGKLYSEITYLDVYKIIFLSNARVFYSLTNQTFKLSVQILTHLFIFLKLNIFVVQKKN